MLKILTLNWEGYDKLDALYPTLLKVLGDIPYQWIIKDNGSKDDSVKLIEGWDNSKIKLIRYKNNLQSFSQGMNLLFNEASPDDEDYVLLLNNDVTFGDTSSLNKMINIMEEDPNVGVVGARLLFTGTNQLQHAGVVFHPRFELPIHFRSQEVSDANAEKNREFQIVTGAVFLTKAKYYKHSYMDEKLFWAFDDCDLALSIKYNLGKKIVYCGETKIFHEESATLKKNPVNKLFMSQNVNHLRSKWEKTYLIDQELYQNNPKHNLYKK